MDGLKYLDRGGTWSFWEKNKTIKLWVSRFRCYYLRLPSKDPALVHRVLGIPKKNVLSNPLSENSHVACNRIPVAIRERSKKKKSNW